MASRTHSATVALAVLPKVSSSLSILGSGWIVTEFLFDPGDKKKRHESVYNRLLFAMSLQDILASVWFFISTWAVPRDTPGDVYQPRGTQQTCTAQGFFLQFSIAVPIYNACLSLYYLLVVKYSLTDKRLRKWIEPTMHAVPWGFASATAVTGLFLDLYNYAYLWCWISPYPLDCLDSRSYPEDANCIRGDNAWIYRWALYFGPLWFIILFASITIILVYREVRKKEARSLKYRRASLTYRKPQVHLERAAIDEVRATHETLAHSAGIRDSKPANASPSTESGVSTVTTANTSSSVESLVSTITEESAPVVEVSESNATGDSFTPAQPDAGNSEPKSSENERTLSSSSSFSSVITRFQNWRKSFQRRREHHPQSYEVFDQALFYLGAFYFSFAFSTINRIVELITGKSVSVLGFLHAFCVAGQGFLNFLVYRRPYYLKHRRKNVSRAKAALNALTWSKPVGQ
jgi:hypothetical protein